MPHLYYGTLKERKAQEQQREQQIQRALQGRKKALESGKRDKRQKKKSVGELLELMNIRSILGKALRPANTYVPKSYNMDKQVVGLLNHLFVQYPVPAFMYQACLKENDPFDEVPGLYREWFVTLAQGGSFSKLVKEQMTSKEAYVFLSAPAANRIHENVWWAKMKVAGIPTAVIEKLMEKIFTHYFFDGREGRLSEVIQFYARYHQDMNKVTFGEITDFVEWKLRNDRGFRMKGRTITSVVRLTNEWHVLMQKAKLGRHVEWKGLGISDWELEGRDRLWTVEQLRSNRELMNEGRKQKHCVYSYVQACVAGRSAIFSLRAYRKVPAGCTEDGQVIWDRSEERTRVTIEVNNHRAVVQVRGLLNRAPDDEEKKALRQWVGDRGLVLREL